MEADDAAVSGQEKLRERNSWDLAQQPGVDIEEIKREYRVLRRNPLPLSSDPLTADVQRIVRGAHLRRLERQILAAHFDRNPAASLKLADELVGFPPDKSMETIVEEIPSSPPVTGLPSETTEKPVTSPPAFEIIYTKGAEPLRICFHTSVFADWSLGFLIRSFGDNVLWNDVSTAGDINELEEKSPEGYEGVLASYFISGKTGQRRKRIKATIFSLENGARMEKFKTHFDQVAPTPDAAKFIMFVDVPEMDLAKFRLVSKKDPNVIFRGPTLQQLSGKQGKTA